MSDKYDYRNCQSLFGYAQEVHRRSGGVCQLCGAGSGAEIDFDFWRQLTVEHVIGTSQGGDYKGILLEVKNKFTALSTDEIEDLAERLELENMVTACSFCNSTTSRHKHALTMSDLIADAGSTSKEVVACVQAEVAKVLKRKQSDVQWKLSSIRERFETVVRNELSEVR